VLDNRYIDKRLYSRFVSLVNISFRLTSARRAVWSSPGKTQTTSGSRKPNATAPWRSTVSASPSRSRFTKAITFSSTGGSAARNRNARTASPRKPKPQSSASSRTSVLTLSGDEAGPKRNCQAPRRPQNPELPRTESHLKRPSRLRLGAFFICPRFLPLKTNPARTARNCRGYASPADPQQSAGPQLRSIPRSRMLIRC
jgi:hypothetical protein